MIEGVVITNGLATPAADRLRNDLWAVMAVDAASSDRGAA